MVQVDRVVQMQQQGMSDNDIINTLKNEGVAPKDISDSIAQARIKMAVSQEEGYQESYNQSPAAQEQQQPAPTQQYQEQQYAQYPDQQNQQQYADQSTGQQYYYPDQGGQSMSIETITEIVDRILSEKLKELNQRIKPVIDFKNKAEEDINDIQDRLKRIESTIDNLQRAIIGKVGEFGQSTALIHRDLENLHGTVSKLMNPLIDNVNEMKKANSLR
jgi:archaellum component FlaC